MAKKPRKGDFLEEKVKLILSASALEREYHGGWMPSRSPDSVFWTQTFTKDKVYESVGLTYHNYDDGSRSLCWMLYDDEGVLQVKDVNQFSKVE